MRRRFFFSEWERDEFEEQFFPPQVSRKAPQWAERLPEEMQELLKEVYTALHANSKRLAVMGARTLVDLFITGHIGDEGTFKRKLELLEENGFISRRNQNVLATALEAGHASSHRGYLPSATELASVMDIVENLLHSDLLEKDAEELSKKIPPRPPRSRARDSEP